MNTTDDLLENIRITELGNVDNQYLTFSSFFLGKSYIAPTSAFESVRVKKDIAYKRFAPNIAVRILLICLIALMFIFMGSVEETSSSSAILAFLILLILIGRLLFLLFSKKRNFAILINPEGINIANTLYRWNEIKATAILYLPVRRVGVNFLILLLKDDTYRKFDLSNFSISGGFDKKISNYIEYFKYNH